MKTSIMCSSDPSSCLHRHIPHSVELGLLEDRMCVTQEPCDVISCV